MYSVVQCWSGLHHMYDTKRNVDVACLLVLDLSCLPEAQEPSERQSHLGKGMVWFRLTCSQWRS